MSDQIGNNRRLFFSNARSRSNSRELKDLFKSYGKVVSFSASKGRGHVEYSHSHQAKDALDSL